MAKAILVMDIPETCSDCFYYCLDDETHECYCSLEGCRWEVKSDGDKPDWCPLIPEPERKETYSASKLIKEAEERDVDPACEAGYRLGWNECLDAIEGKDG